MAATDRDGFSSRLAEAAETVERRLGAILDAAAGAGTPPRLVDAMRHAVLAGGKRFRPFLVIEWAQVVAEEGRGAGPRDVSGPPGGPQAAALEVAAALECVHAYSLVHDDLPAMDNDELRRGRPTVWKAYDEWTAILAGDALLTIAFEILATGDTDVLAPPVRLALVTRLAAASGATGMVGGQMLDLEAEKLGLPARPDAAHVRRLQAMKTGALITFACEAGAMVAGASGKGGAYDALARARTYGDALGLAFQISDDLLDVTGDAATVGKAVGKDGALGKATLVGVEGVEAARHHLDDAVARALGALGGYGPAADILREAARFQLDRRS